MDQSLQRIGLEYVDIFYHHRPDPKTPLEKTMAALDYLVHQGKILYVALSNYPVGLVAQAITILQDLGTQCLIYQPKYSMFERTPEGGLLGVLAQEVAGSIAFSPAGRWCADRPLSQRHPGRFPCRQRQPLPQQRLADA
ncbi:aldo/keto reductase family protein [Candidatus Erwinia dacicola]|uniref:Aldo/keto reductase family protein n=1 Tax=Candidatus Erwinia dacicola TaxID=252393 RepID=A0A328TQN0_9GAMM|nr:aldo/keto reductase family protein [Candidatus Erwinia dacicola]